MARRLKQKGFGRAGIIILVVVIVAIALAAATVLVIELTFGPPEVRITNFQECMAAEGSKLLESFPEQCMTEDGRSFVNPSQSL